LNCNDSAPDYLIAPGTCEHPQAAFNSVLSLTDLALPAALCLRRPSEIEGGLDLTILSFDESTLLLHRTQPVAVLHFVFDHGLPVQEDISGLVSGQTYRLRMTVTDGTTVPVTAEAIFVYQGESRMAFMGPNSPPRALIFPVSTAECTGPTGGVVTLDASGSTDADSTPGTNDDIVSFEWFENPGQPAAIILGSGRVLNTTFPVGTHLIGLVVTDSKMATATAQITLMVRDSAPPSIVCPAPKSAECTMVGGAQVSMVANATDACSPILTISSTRNGEADASGSTLSARHQ